ncbi:unnamed protein product [Owenia fusiformis]|uniref:Uncharacterized protein n=1 Tax=Owenia fusiformis TaxID=6347 RepID=A0A8S4P5Y4_OWEFU|nr:unnamed protein product [Owenia fusiformis]
MDSKQHNNLTTTPTHLYNEHSSCDSNIDIVEEGHDNYAYVDTDMSKTRLPPDGMSVDDDDDGYAGVGKQQVKQHVTLDVDSNYQTVSMDGDAIQTEEEITNKNESMTDFEKMYSKPDKIKGTAESDINELTTNKKVFDMDSSGTESGKSPNTPIPIKPKRTKSKPPTIHNKPPISLNKPSFTNNQTTPNNNIYTSVQKPKVAQKPLIETQEKNTTVESPVIPGKAWGDQNYSDITLNDDLLGKENMGDGIKQDDIEENPDNDIDVNKYEPLSGYEMVEPREMKSKPSTVAFKPPISPNKPLNVNTVINPNNNVYASVQKPQVSPKPVMITQESETTYATPGIPDKAWGDQNYSDITLKDPPEGTDIMGASIKHDEEDSDKNKPLNGCQMIDNDIYNAKDDENIYNDIDQDDEYKNNRAGKILNDNNNADLIENDIYSQVNEDTEDIELAENDIYNSIEKDINDVDLVVNDIYTSDSVV